MPAFDGRRSSIKPRESKPNNGMDRRISWPDRRARPADAGVYNRGRRLLSANADARPTPSLPSSPCGAFVLKICRMTRRHTLRIMRRSGRGRQIRRYQRRQGEAIGFDQGFCTSLQKHFGIYGPADGIFPLGAPSGSVLVTVAPLSRAAKKASIASATWLDALSRHCAEVSASPSFSLER